MKWSAWMSDCYMPLFAKLRGGECQHSTARSEGQFNLLDNNNFKMTSSYSFFRTLISTCFSWGKTKNNNNNNATTEWHPRVKVPQELAVSPLPVTGSSFPWHCLVSLRFQPPASEKNESEEHVMTTGELNPKYYPAQRAAKVAQHYLNTRYGSPFRLYGLYRVHSGNAQVCCWLTAMKMF